MRAAVKWAGTAIIPAGALQLDMFPDDANEIRRFAHLFDDVVGNHWAVRRLGGWAVGSTRSSTLGAMTKRTAPTSTTTRPSERISFTTPTLPDPVLTRSPTARSVEPPNRPTASPAVFSIASSTIRLASLAVASVTAARA